MPIIKHMFERLKLCLCVSCECPCVLIFRMQIVKHMGGEGPSCRFVTQVGHSLRHTSHSTVSSSWLNKRIQLCEDTVPIQVQLRFCCSCMDTVSSLVVHSLRHTSHSTVSSSWLNKRIQLCEDTVPMQVQLKLCCSYVDTVSSLVVHSLRHTNHSTVSSSSLNTRIHWGYSSNADTV